MNRSPAGNVHGTRIGTANSRVALGCVLVAAGVPGVLFAPVFGLGPLLFPIVVLVVLTFGVAELCRWVPVLRPWRLSLGLVIGALGLVEIELRDTTAAGLPTVTSVRALVDGATRSWLVTLQSTWPARPEPDLLLFVPLAVLLAAVLSVELLRRPLLALLPSLAVLGLSQAFVALTGTAAILATLGYAAVAAVLLLVSLPNDRPTPGRTARGALAVTAVLMPAALVAAVLVLPAQTPAYSVQRDQAVPPPFTPLANPLDQVTGWLRQPDVPVFSYTSNKPVDRWRLAVLDDFDGVSWTPGARYRRMGLAVGPGAGLTVPTARKQADISLDGDDGGPWLPSQALPASVTGVDPLIDQRSGSLIYQSRRGAVDYRLSWWEPRASADTLAASAIDPAAESGVRLGAVPAGISDLATTAVHGLRPSFQTALVLARYLSQHYQLATGANLPTGSGWPQLRAFLLTTKRGTSVQFAAAYVVLARVLGIPARLAVGFRAPAPGPGDRVVVRDGDALAWPEVAVAGIGWVPLDPEGAASSAGRATGELSGAVDEAMAELPAQQDLRSPPLPAPKPKTAPVRSGHDAASVLRWMLFVLLGLVVLGSAGAIGVPVLRAVRYWRRRRLPGERGVVAACHEAVDLLRAHGFPVEAGMTVRDLARSVAYRVDRCVVDGLLALAHHADVAVWSGIPATAVTPAPAWEAIMLIRAGLANRPMRTRLRAAFDPAGLLSQRD